MTRDVASDVSALLARGEGATVEFKRALARDLGRELCAFANARGGTVLIGVSDAGKIVGVADHNRVKSQVQSTARSADPPIEVEERPELPEEALREAVANAVAHRDYRSTANVQIYVFRDRIEIVSPGGLPAGMTEADLGTKSMPRNPLLFGMLYRMDVVENIGSGIRRIRRLCREHGVAEPIIDTSGQWVTVTFPRPAGRRNLQRGVRDAGRQPESRTEQGQESSGNGLESDGNGPESNKNGLESSKNGLESDENGLESLQRRVLALLLVEPLSKSALADALGHRSVSAGLNRVMHRLLQDGRVAYTVPGKPNSRLQKYRITGAGRNFLEKPGK